MHKQRINRTPSMILGVEDDQLNKGDDDEKDKYNLDSVIKYNDKNYVPLIKKELTVIPESDISREDSIYNEELYASQKKKDDDDGGFILNKRNSDFKLNFNSSKKNNRKSSTNSNDNNNSNKKDKKDYDNEVNVTEESKGSAIVVEDEGINENEQYEELKDGDGNRLRGKPNLYKSRSRYALDYIDKSVNMDQPNIDGSIFGTIFFSICLSEFGDRTQLISLTTSSIFHFWGSILGSCLALFCSCLIGVYFSRSVMKFFRQKVIDFILGAIFLACGIQIYITKMRSQNPNALM